MGRVVVTGAGGFVGSALAKAFERRGDRVVGVLHPRTDPHRLEDCSVDVARVDLSEVDALAALLRRETPDLVVHAAARGRHPLDRAGREAAWRDTVGSTIALWEALGEVGTQRVVHLGSSLECAPSDRPLREDDPMEPRSVRGAMKAASLLVARQRALECGIACTALRLFSVYGPGEQHHRVVPTVLRCLRDGQRFRLAASESRRDFVHIDDVVDAALEAASHPAAEGQVLNVGSGVETSTRDLVELASEVTGRPLVISDEPYPAQPADRPHACADLTKVSATIGWHPRIGLADGLARTAVAAFGGTVA